MKKVVAISLAVLFVVSFTAVTVSAEREGHHGHGGFGGYCQGGGGYGMEVAIHMFLSCIVGIYGIPAPTCLSGHVDKEDL